MKKIVKKCRFHLRDFQHKLKVCKLLKGFFQMIPLSKHWGVGVIGPLLGCLLPFGNAWAQTPSRAKIVRENKCKVQIEGGEFQIGEKVYFSTQAPDAEAPSVFTVVISQKAKKKVTTWVGKIEQEPSKNCKDALGASLDEVKTSKNRRVPALFDLGLALGRSQISQRGLSWYSPNETQSIPSLASQSVSLVAYPFVATSAPLLSSSKISLQLEQHKSAKSGIEDPAGGKNNLDLKKLDASWEFGFYFMGDSHPSGISAGYSYFGLDTSASDSPFERSVLRDLSCHSIAVGLHQGFFSSGLFRLQFDVDQSFVSRCKVESIADDVAYKLEAKQFALGRSKETVVAASQITNSDSKVTSPSQTRFGTSMAIYPASWIGLKFSVNYWSLGGKIPTKSKAFETKISSFEYTLGLHAAI
jgi:hypothetical protein